MYIMCIYTYTMSCIEKNEISVDRSDILRKSVFYIIEHRKFLIRLCPDLKSLSGPLQ